MATTQRRHTAAEALREFGSVPTDTVPYLLPGVSLVPTSTGFVAYGAAKPQVFGGKSARTVLPAVLHAMDGTLTLTEIADQLGLPHETVATVYSLGATRGILTAAPLPRNRVERWLARSARAIGAAPDSFMALSSVRVTMFGDSVLSSTLADIAAEDGLIASTVDWSPGDPAPSPGSADLMVVVLAQPEPTDALSLLDNELAVLGVPWLRVLIGADRAEIGPRFAADDELRYRDWWRINPVENGSLPDNDSLDAALGFAVLEIINLVTGAGQAVSTKAITEFDLETGSCTIRPRTFRPSGTVCLSHDYAARQYTVDCVTPAVQPLLTPDPSAIAPIQAADLKLLLDTAFGQQTGSPLGAYLLVPPGSNWPTGAHLYDTSGGGLIDLSGMADEREWLRQHGSGADAVLAVSVSLMRSTGLGTLRDALLDTGYALGKLTALAGELGYRVRPVTTGSLGELGDMLGVSADLEPVLEAVLLERLPEATA